MAAVFALIFIPALAAIGFMIKSVQGDFSISTAFAATIFAALAAFVFTNVLMMIKHEEEDEPA